jgi:hypothetical protein
MQRAWILVPLALLGALACRPETYGRKAQVLVPPGSEPRVLQPDDAEVAVEVPADAEMPRGIRTE